MATITALQHVQYDPRTDQIEPVGRLLTGDEVQEEFTNTRGYRVIEPVLGWGAHTHLIALIWNEHIAPPDLHDGTVVETYYLARLA